MFKIYVKKTPISEWQYIGEVETQSHANAIYNKANANGYYCKVVADELKEEYIMQSYTMRDYQYNRIKDIVPHGEPYFYQEVCFGRLETMVEVDLDETVFNSVQDELM